MPKCSYCQHELVDPSLPCPKCGAQQGVEAHPHGLTLRQLQLGAEEPKPMVPSPTRVETPPRNPATRKLKPDMSRFRPLYRPPMLVICVLDDDGTDGEYIRVRGDSFVIGRTEGDLCIPHELSMSSRHLEFARVSESGEVFWRVRDLDTSNGTFARVERARLTHGQHLLLGRHRFRLDALGQGAAVHEPNADMQETRQGEPAPRDEDPAPPRRATQSWNLLSFAAMGAALVRLGPKGLEERFSLESEEQWIGSDGRACRIAIPGDPWLDPKHARLYRESRRWCIEDAQSVNGTWVSVTQLRIDTYAELQVGEQRFKVKVP